MVEELPVDAYVACVYADIVLSLREIGMPLPVNDIWIGACAATARASVITYDADFRHIRRVGAIVLGSGAGFRRGCVRRDRDAY